MTSWRLVCDGSVAECCVALAVWAVCAGLAFRGERARRLPLFLLATTCPLLFIQPIFEIGVERPRPVAILVDDSASMRRGLEDASPSVRAKELAKIAADHLNAEDVDVEFRTLFGNDDENVLSYESPIYLPLTDPKRLNVERFSTVLVLTDGVPVPDFIPPSVPARDRPAIRFAFLGDLGRPYDLRVVDFAPPTSDFPFLRARVEALGALDKQSFRVRLWKRDESSKKVEMLIDETLSPELLEEGRSALEIERVVEFSDAPASYLFFVSDSEDDFDPTSAPVDDLRFHTGGSEFCYANNGAAFSSDSKDAKIRVLLVDEEPRPEYRYLRETLRRESDVDLTASLLAADSPAANLPDVELFNPAFLARCDVVIIGELDERTRASLDVALDSLDASPNPPALWFTSPRAPAFEVDESEVDESGVDASDEDSEWRVDPTPATARALGDARLPDAGVALIDVVRFEPLPRDAFPLLNARNDATGERVPLLVASRRGRLPALSQSAAEFWRLRAGEDKTIYRRFVRGVLDYLTSSPRDAGGGVAAPASPESENVRDAFEYYALGNAPRRREEAAELASGRFRGEELTTLATRTGGACVDLRGAELEEQARRIEEFLPPAAASYRETVSTSRALCPPRFGAPLGLALTVWILALEARGLFRRRDRC